MAIITAPHQTLRQPAREVTSLDQKVVQLVQDLEQTLGQSDDPPGVGLAAPQVDKKYRVFATQLPTQPENQDSPLVMHHFINPQITKTSSRQIMGATPQDQDDALEGCLSIPQLYGPVPRWEWVELEFSYIKDPQTDPRLQQDKRRFHNFEARVIQHELDHLEGILFTDYLLEYDLPAYQVDPHSHKLIELHNRDILEVL